MEHQISIQDLLCGRTFPEPSAVTVEQTSKQSCKPSAICTGQVFQFLCLKEGSGDLLGASWETASALRGVSTTLNTGESPSDVRESTLSQILDLNAPGKYSLSQKACAGILRRAEARKKELPSMLQDALMEAVGSNG